MRKVLSSTASWRSTNENSRCPTLSRARPALERGDHVLGGDRRAVVELQPVAQRERVDELVRADLVLADHLRLRVELRRRCRTACRRPASRGCRRWSAWSRSDRACARRRAARRAAPFAPGRRPSGRRRPQGRARERSEFASTTASTASRNHLIDASMQGGPPMHNMPQRRWARTEGETPCSSMTCSRANASW